MKQRFWYKIVCKSDNGILMYRAVESLNDYPDYFMTAAWIYESSPQKALYKFQRLISNAERQYRKRCVKSGKRQVPGHPETW